MSHPSNKLKSKPLKHPSNKKGTKAAIPPSRMPNGSEQPAQPASVKRIKRPPPLPPSIFLTTGIGSAVPAGFHPEMFRLPNLHVNPDRVGIKQQPCLCLPVPARKTGDALRCVSAQALVFLDLGQHFSAPIWKLRSVHSTFPNGHSLEILVFLDDNRTKCKTKIQKTHFPFVFGAPSNNKSRLSIKIGFIDHGT
jgi:hypothetical protein